MAIEYLTPTEKNITDCFLKDSLGRQKYVIQFCHLLSSYREAVTIGLDGIWGSGKTFFVKQCKQVLDAINIQSSLDQDIRVKINNALCGNSLVSNLQESPCYTVYYDAWEHDDQSDPLLSLIYSIAVETNTIDQLDRPLSFSVRAGIVADMVSGRNILEIVRMLKDDKPLSAIQAQAKLKDAIKEYLKDLPCERGERVNIFIDELDRCSPQFAITLLERIKHYINDDRITFIFSVNLQSLEKTVCHYYGEQMEGTRYLDRFFDLRMMLPPSSNDLIVHQLDFGGVVTGERICKHLIKRFHFSLREALRFAGFYKRACKIQHNDPAVAYWIKYFLPIALALELKDMDLFQNFISGDDDARIELLFDIDTIQDQLKYDFSCFLGIDDVSTVDINSVKEVAKKLYKSFFDEDYYKSSYVSFGRGIEISYNTRVYIYETLGLFCDI